MDARGGYRATLGRQQPVGQPKALGRSRDREAVVGEEFTNHDEDRQASGRDSEEQPDRSLRDHRDEDEKRRSCQQTRGHRAQQKAAEQPACRYLREDIGAHGSGIEGMH